MLTRYGKESDNMEVINQKKNPLMNREEAWILIDHAGKATPPRKDMITEVAKHFKAKEDEVIIDKIFSEVGKAASRVKVLVYPKADAIPKAKLDKMKIRMGLMEKPKKGEKPAGDKPPEQTPGQISKPEEKKEAAEEKVEEKKEDAAKEVTEEKKEGEKKEADSKEEKPNDTKEQAKEGDKE
jgi:ribosomal protein S24E